jgi:tetratricopeptide (TPR) repeat protein
MAFAKQLIRACAVALFSCSLLAQTNDLAEKSHRAKQLMDTGQYQEAIPIYRELVREVPGNPGLIYDLGLALDMSGHKREAVRQFEAALKLDPQQLPAMLFLGMAYLELGEPAKALAPLEKVVKAIPDNFDAQEVLAETYLALGKLELSADKFQRLAHSDPQNAKVWYSLGQSYQGLAQENFDELVKLAPGSAYWLDLVGESRLKVLQYSSAFFFYKQALGKMSSMRGAHAALAEIYKNTGHADWSSVEEQKENEMPPPDCAKEKMECDFRDGNYTQLIVSAAGLKTPESYYWRTRAYNQLTLQAFARLGEMPQSTEYHELMATIKFDRREFHDAAQEWQEALKLSPGNAYIQKELALSLIRNKDLEGARTVLEPLVKQTPDSPELNYMLGDTLLNLQQVEDAIPHLKKAVLRDPNFLVAHSSLARAYLQMGDFQQAIPHLKAALPIDDDGSLHYQLARAYQSSGRAELAKAILKDYQEIVKATAAANETTAKEVQISAPE